MPFVGGKVAVSKTNVDWSADPNWEKILSETDGVADAVAWGVLPSHFGGGSSTDYMDNVRPVVYGGLGIDLLFLDITASASYDISKKIPSAAVSVRIAWN